ncbi:MAG: hypothetical protein ACKOAH_28225, partial [Pirellula sp.]
MDVSGRANRSGVLFEANMPAEFDELVAGEFAGHRVDEFVQTQALLLGQLELPFESLGISLGLNLRFVRFNPVQAEELSDRYRRIPNALGELQAGKCLKELPRVFVARMKATVEPSAVEQLFGFNSLDKFVC